MTPRAVSSASGITVTKTTLSLEKPCLQNQPCPLRLVDRNRIEGTFSHSSSAQQQRQPSTWGTNERTHVRPSFGSINSRIAAPPGTVENPRSSIDNVSPRQSDRFADAVEENAKGNSGLVKTVQQSSRRTNLRAKTNGSSDGSVWGAPPRFF